MKPDVYFNVGKYAAKYGLKAAAEVALFEASNVYAMKDLVEKERIDCDFILTRAVDATLDPQLAKESIAAYHNLVQDGGIETLKDVQYYTQRDAEGVRTSRFLCCPDHIDDVLTRYRVSKEHYALSALQRVQFGHTKWLCIFSIS